MLSIGGGVSSSPFIAVGGIGSNPAKQLPELRARGAVAFQVLTCGAENTNLLNDLIAAS
jgi:hypothetical protein